MKKVFLFVSAMAMMVACDNTTFEGGEDPTFGWLEFPSATSTVSATSDLMSVPIAVSFTAPINKEDLTLTYSVVGVDGIDAGTIVTDTEGSTTIVGDTNTGEIVLNLLPDAALVVAANDEVSLDIEIVSNDRSVLIGVDENTVTTHRLTLVCDLTLDIGGTYSVTTDYGFHDFLPDFSSYTYTTDIVDNGDGTFFVQDFSGGLYTEGPYVTAYGTGPTSFDVNFTNACRQIIYPDQGDPWGAVIPLDGGVNEIDLSTGIITISWFCEGYGENGVSVYTPL
ncbi:hypothetical protein J4050_09555 [Winogradskyella sp. DF17]|uniref:Calx-beta domain-containing protein n=1 Tax=Winogradskyella pelagia TaxID=2819984 RepID=A0ABS3T3Z2_9FLAO|nr:hypothetical protein [Winogradskyella sp. DF17]MBO3116994.1 hypothetical protein [Winogradskyella sp. DF17]